MLLGLSIGFVCGAVFMQFFAHKIALRAASFALEARQNIKAKL